MRERLAAVRVQPAGDDEAAADPVAPIARYPAEATDDGPSYSEALETGRPVSSDIAVWNSNIACRWPCETSGWYGVYGVRNSERCVIASTIAGT